MGFFQTFPVVELRKIKESPTRLKVTTTLKKKKHSTHDGAWDDVPFTHLAPRAAYMRQWSGSDNGLSPIRRQAII